MLATLARPAKVSVVVTLAAAWGAVFDDRDDRVAWPLCTPSVHAQESEARGVFHGVGVVTAVDRAKGWLTLDHEAIKGFMAAMEMMYRVDPPRLAAGLQVGDRVAFDIDSTRYAVVAIRLLPRTQ
jgi:Cu/Ag efflux protein CusF